MVVRGQRIESRRKCSSTFFQRYRLFIENIRKRFGKMLGSGQSLFTIRFRNNQTDISRYRYDMKNNKILYYDCFFFNENSYLITSPEPLSCHGFGNSFFHQMCTSRIFYD